MIRWINAESTKPTILLYTVNTISKKQKYNFETSGFEQYWAQNIHTFIVVTAHILIILA